MAQGAVKQDKILTCGGCGFERVYRMKSGKLWPDQSTPAEVEACKVLTEGAASSYTAQSLTQTGAGWTPDQWKGRSLKVIAFDQKIQMTLILSNTADTLVLRHVLRGNGWPSRPYADPLFKPGELPTFEIIDHTMIPSRADIAAKLWNNNSFICVCGTQQDDIDK